MAHANPIRILIVDDHPAVREGLKCLIATQPDMAVAGEAETFWQAKMFLKFLTPDVTLLDLRLPDVRGTEAISELAKSHPGNGIIVFSSCMELPDIHACLASGAKSHILKDIPRAELFAAIRHVAEGLPFFSRRTAEAARKSLIATANLSGAVEAKE